MSFHPFSHFITITKHKNMVMKYCFKIGLIRQGLLHDLSKYLPSEFWVGARYYQGDRSPNNAEREDIGYSSAWLHHKGCNKHHYEYWIDYSAKDNDGSVCPIRMPKKYVAEMMMDRLAASKIYKGKYYNDNCPLEYYNLGKNKRIIHPDTKRDMENMLMLLSEKGEEALLRYVKEEYLKR